jgi:heptosyltransferase-2
MEKILVIQTAFIGDAILTLPMIQKLKETYRNSEIHVISNPVTSSIFDASPVVDKVIVLDKTGTHKSFFSTIKFAKNIRKEKFTKLFSPHRSFRTSLLVLLSEIKETYGFDISSLGHIYKYLVNYNFNAHEVQRNLDLTGAVYDEDSWKILPQIKITDDIKKKIDIFVNENNRANSKIAVIAPGSIWNTKRYPEEYFSEIINFFISEKFIVFLIGSEQDESLCNSLSSKFTNDVVSATGKFSIIESIELLKRAMILISNDSAPTHMGMCANIPVLTLYCSTSHRFGFYPYNNKSSYLSYDNLSCKPCGIHGYDECPVKTFDCGQKLVPGKVITKIKEMLND